MVYYPCPAGTRGAQLALVTGQLLHTNLQGLTGTQRRGGVHEGSTSGTDTAPGTRDGQVGTPASSCSVQS